MAHTFRSRLQASTTSLLLATAPSRERNPGFLVAQTFLSAVSPTFLSADFDQYTFLRAKAESKQAESAAIPQTFLSDRNVCATLNTYARPYPLRTGTFRAPAPESAFQGAVSECTGAHPRTHACRFFSVGLPHSLLLL